MVSGVKPEEISSALDPRLEDYRNVRDPRWLREREIFLAEGRKVVREVLRAKRFQVRSLLVTAAALDGLKPEISRLGPDTLVYLIAREHLDRVSGVRFHQGCVAAVDVPAARDPAHLIDASARRVVVLEAVTDPDNVGSIFRNASAFGVDAVFLDARCASPLYRKSVRTSLGATLRVPFGLLELPPGLAWLRGQGFRVLAMTPDARATDLDDEPIAERTALLLGSEGSGLSDEALAGSDARVRIAMAAEADSINVATAGAIAMQRVYARAST